MGIANDSLLMDKCLTPASPKTIIGKLDTLCKHKYMCRNAPTAIIFEKDKESSKNFNKLATIPDYYFQ